MKLKEYNQMMDYLTRKKEPTIKVSNLDINRHMIDTLNKFEDKPDIIEEVIRNSPTPVRGYKGEVKPYTTYSNGGTTKNQKKISIPKKKTPLATEKNNIIIAMSETPTEEYQLDLSTEIEQFQEWLKNNKNGTYKEYLKDKTALLTEEQKKDPKIIDLEPYLPNFKDVIKQYEKEQEEKKETLEEFIYIVI